MSTQETNAQERTGDQENPEPTTIEELQEDIERTRERLGETVDELSHRLDVKGRAHDKVTDVKAAAQEKAVDVKSVVGARVKPLAQRREIQAAAGGAMLLGVGAAVIARRRGK